VRALLVLGLVVAATGPAAVAAPPGPPTSFAAVVAIRYRPPLDAPVVDAFRPPASPYGPGNRGWEYAATVGSPVRAAGAGTVAFAGVVAGRGVVTIVHPDGLRTSYTGLVDLTVTVAQRVEAGDVLGRAAGLVHFGVRRGTVYVDPALLFGRRHARLVCAAVRSEGSTTSPPSSTCSTDTPS